MRNTFANLRPSICCTDQHSFVQHRMQCDLICRANTWRKKSNCREEGSRKLESIPGIICKSATGSGGRDKEMLMTWWGSWSWFKDKNRNKDKKDVYEICLPRHQNYSVRFINWRERILRDRKWFQIGVEVTKEMTTWYRRSGILMILILLGSWALLRQSSGSKSGKIGINIFRISAWTFLGRDATADFKLQRSGKRRSVSCSLALISKPRHCLWALHC